MRVTLLIRYESESTNYSLDHSPAQRRIGLDHQPRLGLTSESENNLEARSRSDLVPTTSNHTFRVYHHHPSVYHDTLKFASILRRSNPPHQEVAHTSLIPSRMSGFLDGVCILRRRSYTPPLFVSHRFGRLGSRRRDRNLYYGFLFIFNPSA